MADPDSLCWPVSRTTEAIEALASHHRLPVRPGSVHGSTWGVDELDARAFDAWVEALALSIGIEAEPVLVEHADVEAVLRRAYPAIVRVPPRGPLFLLVGRRGRDAEVLGPDLTVTRVPVAELRAKLCDALEAPVRAATDAWLGPLPLTPARRERVRDAVLADVLSKAPAARAYLVRPLPGASFSSSWRFEGLSRKALFMALAYAGQYLLGLAAWYALGSGAFGGSIERDWLILWGLIVLTAVPVQIAASWLASDLLRGMAVGVKRRLLAGALAVEPDELRREGAGQLLGRTLDAGTVESLVLGGGLVAALALVEVLVLAALLAAGSGGALQAAAFFAWGGLTLVLGWQSFQRTQKAARQKRELTQDLVEHMVGHRTRLAQEAPHRWHDGEDEALERYGVLSRAMDRKDVQLRAMPQGWYLLGLGSLVPGLLQGRTTTGGLAVAIGGVLLGGAALGKIAGSFAQLTAASAAWSQVKPLYDAASRPEAPPSAEVVAARAAETRDDPGSVGGRGAPLLDATDVVFSYPGRPQPVVRRGTMKIRAGDRILFEGPSGGGKSTFASILAGARRASSGLLLLEGLDWETVGARGWRKRVAAAPQFHENHILSETLLFNVCMGRRWPPSPDDIAEAEAVCRELGLAGLLERMPAGIMQMIGDTGWRLSQGERSRVFIARALLQGAKVVVLDESFAALDPETVAQCLRCVHERAPALLVIAHP